MKRYIKQLSATNVHGQYNYDLTFKQGINILYGQNGSGKTTILHILANAIQGDFRRFVALEFETIELTFSDETVLSIKQLNRVKKGRNLIHHHADISASLDGELLFEKKDICENRLRWQRDNENDTQDPLIQVDYFPAFRLLIDAFDNVQVERKQTLSDIAELLQHTQNRPEHNDSRLQDQSQIVQNTRTVLGEFVPYFEFPPASAIEGLLNDLLAQAIAQVNAVDREQFINIFTTIDDIDSNQNDSLASITPSQLKERIEELLAEYKKYPIHVEQAAWEKLEAQLLGSEESRLSEFLPAFYRALKTIVEKQQQYLDTFDTLVADINSFLVDKEIVFGETGDSGIRVQLCFEEKDKEQCISNFYHTLSSGERHILALIYAATQTKNTDVVLIDEPEISLHTSWQRRLLSVIQDKTKDTIQIIACTHSPEIGEYHLEQITNLGGDNGKKHSEPTS